MRTTHSMVTSLIAVFVVAACSAAPSDPAGTLEQPTTATTGSGAPSGAHFNLNIIGVPQDKTMSGGSGDVIFVPLQGQTKILLSEGPFAVLDKNGTDGQASFQLPNPDPTGSGTTTYSVFARALGTPGGSATATTCATDPATGELLCSIDSAVFVRSGGKQTFTNVSKELLFVTVDVNGTTQRIPLFDSSLSDFFWQFDNNGLKVAQLRFYPVATTVN